MSALRSRLKIIIIKRTLIGILTVMNRKRRWKLRIIKLFRII